jgi:hypothetical protein
MTKYKLKKEARQFFEDKYHQEIKEISFWKDLCIPIQLLDEVDIVYVDYGHESILTSGTKTSSLKGWSREGKRAEFRFSLQVNDIEISDYEKVDIVELMDEIQKVTNSYFKYWLK